MFVHSIVSDFTSNKQCMPCENISGKTLTSQLFTLSKITLGAQFCWEFNTVSIARHHWRNSRHKQSARCFLFHNFNVNCIFSRQTVSVIFKSCPFSQCQCQCQCQHPRAMFAADLNFSQSQCRPLGINVLTLALLVNTVDQLFPTHKYKMSLIHEMAVTFTFSIYIIYICI